MTIYLQITVRAIASYFTLLILTRLMGKREISQMTFFDYCVGITIGSIAANLAIDTTMEWYNIIPALIVFAILQIVFSYVSLKSDSFRKVVDGDPNVLISNGKIMEGNMLKSRLNSSELLSLLREKNAFNLADVETAILETDGKISVQFKSDKSPVTPSDIKIKTQASGLPVLVIEEGMVNEDGLRAMKLSRAWLMSKLGEKNVYDYSKVMIAQVDSSGNLYVDLYEDNIADSKQNTGNKPSEDKSNNSSNGLSCNKSNKSNKVQ